MGFSGGGSNVLKPHKHSSAVQDGSPLNMVNVTEGSLNLGDIVYSDGNALQRLAIGTPAQQIKVNAGATAPEYFTPAGASATWEVLSDTVLVAPGTLTSETFSAQDQFIKVLFYGAVVSSTTLGITCNNSNGADEYAYSSFRDYTTTTGGDIEKSMGYLTGVATDNACFLEMTGYNGGSTDDKLFNITTCANITTGNTRPISYQSASKYYGGDYITSFEMVDANPGTTVNFAAGSRLLVLATPA